MKKHVVIALIDILLAIVLLIVLACYHKWFWLMLITLILIINAIIKYRRLKKLNKPH